MKRYTAFLVAISMVFVLVVGGVVYLFPIARAVQYESDIERSQLPIVNQSTVSTLGAIIATDGNGSIVRAGANQGGVYPFAITNQFRFATANPNGVFYWSETSGSNQVNIDSEYYYTAGVKIYFYRINLTGYQFSVPSSGNGSYQMLYDATCFLKFGGQRKYASFLGQTPYNNTQYIDISNQYSLTAYNATGNDLGYITRVGSTLYYFPYNNNGTKLYITSADHNTIVAAGLATQTIVVNGDEMVYETYTLPSSNVAVCNFASLIDAANQVYYWETGIDPTDNPNDNPDDEIPPISGTMSYQLKPGYAILIKSSTSFPVVMSTQMPMLSNLTVSSNGSWWSSSSAFTIIPSSDPTIGTTVPVANDNTFTNIPWMKQSIVNGVRVSHNILGQTKYAMYAHQYNAGSVLIVNPVSTYTVSSNGNTAFNNNIVVEFDAEEAYIYPFAETAVGDIIAGTLTGKFTLGGNGLTYDSENNVFNLQYGGASYVENKQKATLSDLVEKIEEFFEGSWSHIRQLISSVGKFPSVVIELYSWLPMEYKSVIFSAFSITMMVAVIKVML